MHMKWEHPPTSVNPKLEIGATNVLYFDEQQHLRSWDAWSIGKRDGTPLATATGGSFRWVKGTAVCPARRSIDSSAEPSRSREKYCPVHGTTKNWEALRGDTSCSGKSPTVTLRS